MNFDRRKNIHLNLNDLFKWNEINATACKLNIKYIYTSALSALESGASWIWTSWIGSSVLLQHPDLHLVHPEQQLLQLEKQLVHREQQLEHPEQQLLQPEKQLVHPEQQLFINLQHQAKNPQQHSTKERENQQFTKSYNKVVFTFFGFNEDKIFLEFNNIVVILTMICQNILPSVHLKIVFELSQYFIVKLIYLHLI